VGLGTKLGTATSFTSAQLEKVNARLKALECRCSIQKRNERFYLRASLPDRETGLIKQQRLPLGEVSLREAEEEGIRLGKMIRDGDFSWDAWDRTDQTGIRVITAGELRTKARELFEKKKRADTTWQRKWMPSIRKLPKGDHVQLTEAFLLKIVESMPVGSAGRKTDGTMLARYAEFVGMDGSAIREASLGYTEKDVVKREPPSDDQIIEAFNRITAPHWKWQFGCAAVYGLRPHEIPLTKFTEDWDCIVPDETKSGYHVAWGVHSTWIDLFGIKDICRGDQSSLGMSNSWTKARKRYEIDIPLYDLRHAYALRCMRKGIQTTVAAKLMGHSEAIHIKTYRRWLDQHALQQMKSLYDI